MSAVADREARPVSSQSYDDLAGGLDNAAMRSRGNGWRLGRAGRRASPPATLNALVAGLPHSRALPCVARLARLPSLDAFPDPGFRFCCPLHFRGMAQIADDGFIYVERKRPARKQRKGKQPMALSLVQRMEDLSLARKAFAVACQGALCARSA
jgi:hypothetical protein